jgi:hypothetical protein
MIEISVQADIKAATRWLDDVQKKQIPFALKNALNQTARDVQADLTKEMRVFDRPKASTVKGTYIMRAEKTKLSAIIGLKTRDKGAPVSEYLEAQVEGGYRSDKRSEILLQQAGILPRGYQTRPGSGANIDRYGNMTRGQIVGILSYFRAFGGIRSSGRNKPYDTQSEKLNRSLTKRKRLPVEYFIVPDGMPGLATGVWKRSGKKIEPILIFIRPPVYTKKYGFYEFASSTVRRKMERNFNDAMKYALATAR